MRRKTRIPFRISLIIFYFVFPFLELLIFSLFSKIKGNPQYDDIVIPGISWWLIVIQGFALTRIEIFCRESLKFTSCDWIFMIINIVLLIVIYPLIIFLIGSVIDKKLKLRRDRKLGSIT